MSDSDKTPPEKSPFWRFSIKFYAVPGVAPSCIELQDKAGVDVNVLFFLLWNASQGRALNAADVAKIEEAIRPWREMAVVPLREVRRALKMPPPVVASDAAETFRNRVKSAELEAERLQQEALYALAASGKLGGRPAPSAVKAAQDSISSYQGVIGPFPPHAIETVMAAFVKFEAPQ
jgi:uncharacterized protein (TIGR02444 family)